MPRLLDLFCGGGGAAAGYDMAGFEVVGVDIRPQPSYPFRFIQDDAIAYLDSLIRDFTFFPFDAIHASPPCQPYSKAVTSRSSRWNDTLGKDEPALIESLRERFQQAGIPWVIENVEDAPLGGIILCGSMFGLDIQRHRRFESSILLLEPGHPRCNGISKRAAERRGWDYRDMSVTGKGRRAGTSERWAELLGITWPMRQRDLKEAIPPAYTAYVGQQILESLT